MAVNNPYQQTIIEHNKSPRNYRTMHHPTHKAEGYNKICGDHIHLYLMIQNGMIHDIAFDGDSCAICKSSASMMTEALQGKTLTEVHALFEQFDALLNQKCDPSGSKNNLGLLSVFTGIWKLPTRIKCARLPWYTLMGAIAKKKNISAE